MDWDQLIKQIENEEFPCTESIWGTPVMKFLCEYMTNISNRMVELQEKKNKVSELKWLIGIVCNFPNSWITMMQDSVDKMEVTDIDNYITLYRNQYEQMRLQCNEKVTASNRKVSTGSHNIHRLQSIDQYTLARQTSTYMKNFAEEIANNQLLQPYYVNLLQNMSEEERFNFQKQWFINAIAVIKLAEEEIAKLQ